MVWMTAALALALAVLSFIWLGLLWRFFALREEFEVKARSPLLVAISGGMNYVLCMSVLLRWLLGGVGKTLPCYVVFAVSYGVLAFGVTPYVIRAVRLVVAYSTKYRAKYAKFVKIKRCMKLWGAITAGLVVRAFFFFGKNPAHFSSDARECFYWDDTVLLGACILFGGGPTLVLACKLFRVHDAFKLREELLFMIAGCSLGAGIMCTLQILVAFDFLPDAEATHVAVEAVALLSGLNVGIFGLLIPMARAHRGGPRSWTRAAVLPVEETSFTDFETESEVGGVLAIATAGGEMAELFANFCRRNLTMESWDFIIAALHYETTGWSDPDAQFEGFVHVLNQYLLPVSPDEVNIESKMRKRLASEGKRDYFFVLDADARKLVLREPLNEIVRMLEQNLLTKFRRSLAAQKERPPPDANIAVVRAAFSLAFLPQLMATALPVESQLAEAAKGDVELLELMRVSCISSRPQSES